jgi:eukaryotic-like serine/threonine-protein kinase
VVGLVAVAVLLTAVGTRLLIPPAAPVASVTPIRLSIAVPDGDQVIETNMLPLAISPDGSRVAYVGLREGVQHLFLRSLASSTPTLVVDTEGARSPFFSPDGQWVGFFAHGKVKKAAVAGGAVQVIADGAPDARGGAWSPDGTIYFAPSNTTGLWKVPAAGGTAVEFTRLAHGQGEISHRWPQVLADGKSVLYSSWTGPGPDERVIVAQDLATGDRRIVVRGGDTIRYLSSGFVTYGRLDTLLAIPWKPGQQDASGAAPISFPEFPRMENEGAADYSISSNGTMAYVAGGAARYAQRVVWADRTGATETIPVPERDIESVGLSPDGRRAVVQVREGTMGLWLYDFERRTLSPFATSGGSSQGGVWSPDGRRIFYRGTRRGARNVYWKPSDGSGEEVRLTDKSDVVQTPSSISADGQWLFFSEAGKTGVWVVHPDGKDSPRLVMESAQNGQISRDGRWLALQSTVSGQLEVYVVPFPGPGPRIPISVNGGYDPKWSHDGRELFYTRGNKFIAVSVTTGATFSAGTPRLLYEGRFRASPNSLTAWDVGADGRRFLRVQQVQPDPPVTSLEVVLNWGSQLQQLAARR